ncbi:hypothetical protein EHI7A_078150 [Entamoeba histolytica HM-1:IMSS-A]|uniref:Uncharacterized protein n=1 Tax=Entamoeba histolytica HM-1:IMSS-A TaxID=885318 RepID=N9TDB2_ENTH1|nr:hypothetical protein EHI7A_078150 [Entamoeba histolytica HM-1:IMSS-A]
MATINFNIHYITYFGQDLYVCFNDSECVPMNWTNGHMWVGKKTINGPTHLEWYYLVKVHNKIQRIEEVHGLREYNFNGNSASVRDWWYYPELTYVTDTSDEQGVINKQGLDEKTLKAKKEAEEKAKKEAEEKAKKEAEEKAKKEAEEKAKKEAEEKAKKEAEEKAKKEAEEKAKKEAEEKARKEKSEKEKQERLKQLPSLDESVGFYPVQRSKGSPSSSDRSSERSSERNESNRLKRSSQIQEQIRKYEELAKSSQEDAQKSIRHTSSSKRVSKTFGK